MCALLIFLINVGKTILSVHIVRLSVQRVIYHERLTTPDRRPRHKHFDSKILSFKSLYLPRKKSQVCRTDVTL